MQRKIVFIGGIHGVGKSTLCTRLVSELKVPHYSASELIKRVKSGLFNLNKTVPDVSKNQDVLLFALNEFVTEPCFILDGHFSLFNSEHQVQDVPESVFIAVAPAAICVLTCDIKNVIKRIEDRDGVTNDITDYEKLNRRELSQARNIANTLKIPLLIHDTSTNEQELIAFVKSQLE